MTWPVPCAWLRTGGHGFQQQVLPAGSRSLCTAEALRAVLSPQQRGFTLDSCRHGWPREPGCCILCSLTFFTIERGLKKQINVLTRPLILAKKEI